MEYDCRKTPVPFSLITDFNFLSEHINERKKNMTRKRKTQRGYLFNRHIEERNYIPHISGPTEEELFHFPVPAEFKKRNKA